MWIPSFLQRSNLSFTTDNLQRRSPMKLLPSGLKVHFLVTQCNLLYHVCTSSFGFEGVLLRGCDPIRFELTLAKESGQSSNHNLNQATLRRAFWEIAGQSFTPY